MHIRISDIGPLYTFRKSVLLLIISVLLLTLLSWLRFLFLRNPAPDYAFLPSPFNLSGIAVLFVSIIMTLVAQLILVRQADVYGLSNHQKLSLLFVGILLSLVATFMLPLLSNDIFSVLSYVDLFWNTDVDPYTLSGSGLKASKYYSLIGPTWKNTPCVYSPVQLIFWAPAVLFSGNNLFIAMAIFKILVFVLVLGMIVLLYRYVMEHNLEKTDDPMFAAVIVSPILWVEGAGQAHNDILVAFFLAAWIYFASKRQTFLAGIMIGLALASKLTALLPCIMYVIYLMHRSGLFRGLLVAFIIFATVVLSYIPVWNGIDTLKIPFNTMVHSNITNTLFEILQTISVKLFKFDESYVNQYLHYMSTVLKVSVVFLGIYEAIKAVTFQDVVNAMAKVYLLLTLVATQFYHPWYLLPCLVLALKLRENLWKKWFIVVSTLGILLDGSVILARGSIERQIYSAATVTLQCILVCYLIFKIIIPQKIRESISIQNFFNSPPA
jgi:uncharacterized membrane protein